MKYKILLCAMVAATFASCSSAYRASQTPDDVYYSPAGVQKQSRNEDKYEDYSQNSDDQYLRMKTRDRQRWSSLDDYSYWNDSRYVPSFSYNYYQTNWYNPYAWNNWNSSYYYPMYAGSYNYYGYYYPQYGYNSYGSNVYVTKTPSRFTPSVNRPNLNGYTNGSYSNTNNNRNYSTGGRGNRSGIGGTLQRVFAPSNNGNEYSNRNNTNNNTNNNTYTAPVRSYTPSSSSGGSSSGSSGGSVSRPVRH